MALLEPSLLNCPRVVKRVKHSCRVMLPRVTTDHGFSCRLAQPRSQRFISIESLDRSRKRSGIARLNEQAVLGIDNHLGYLTEPACDDRFAHRHVLEEFRRRAEKFASVV